MKFLKVPRKQAEAIRHELVNEKKLSNEYQIINEGDFVLFPILTSSWRSFEIVERIVEKNQKRFTNLKDELARLLSGDELNALVASFDIVGDIAIIEVPAELVPIEQKIGETILKIHHNLRTVVKKLGPMEGEYRVRKLAPIAGEKRTETVYVESGVRMKLDLAKVYFSVRLAFERTRIAELVQPNERILVLFAGVGPFALVIAKKHKKDGVEVVAVELNPDAVKYARENVELNKLKNVRVVEGDARKFNEKEFNRVVMPLPKTGYEFLDIAFSAVKNGGTVHFYSWADIEKGFDETKKKVEEAARREQVVVSFENERVVRPYAPNIVQVVLDIKVKK
jgi:tRNA (guanine37-N1)-methyltransferase